MCAIVTLELNALVEIINGLSEPQADDQERGDTDHETKDTDPSTGPLDHGPIKGRPELAEPPTEGNQAEQDEEDNREPQGDANECGSGGRGGGQPTGCVAWKYRKII